MKIVEVVWDDAHVSTSEMTLKRAQKVKPVRTHTIAYLMAETDEGITLATDRYEKDPKIGKIINHIPWGIIVEYTELVK